MAPLGKRIRDTERALKKCVDLEKQASLRELLKKLTGDKEMSKIKIKEKTNSQKYHLVKFVERQKLCRKLHKIEKAHADDKLSEKERVLLLSKKKSFEEDLTYVLYFPMSMKYIGERITVFPNAALNIIYYLSFQLSLQTAMRQKMRLLRS